MPIDVTSDDFEEKVVNSDVPVLVDFWAPWCGPCMMMHPVLETLAEKYRDRAVVAKVNIAESNNEQLAQRYQIRQIPFMAIFHNGDVVDTIIGVRPEEELAASLDGVLGG